MKIASVCVTIFYVLGLFLDHTMEDLCNIFVIFHDRNIHLIHGYGNFMAHCVWPIGHAMTKLSLTSPWMRIF